LKADNKI